MTDYENLSKIDFLPEMERVDLAGKAKVIQSLLEESFFHPSGLFYSILLIDGPRHVRPMAREDLAASSVHVAEMFDQGTREAARNEGMTFENSITSAGNYLQSQTARFVAAADPAAYAQAVRAFASLRMIYDHGKANGRAGWLGKPYGARTQGALDLRSTPRRAAGAVPVPGDRGDHGA